MPLILFHVKHPHSLAIPPNGPQPLASLSARDGTCYPRRYALPSTKLSTGMSTDCYTAPPNNSCGLVHQRSRGVLAIRPLGGVDTRLQIAR
jgi:hypothetical protein